MTKRLLIFIGSLLTCLLATAQDDDFGYSLEVSGETKIMSGLKLELDASVRTQDNAEKIDRYTVGADLSYKLFSNKKLSIKANGGFEYMWTNKLAEVSDKYKYNLEDDTIKWWGSNKTEQYWRNRYRVSFGVSASYTLNKRWSFSFKEVFQYNRYCSASTNKIKHRPFGINGDDEWYDKDPSIEEIDEVELQSYGAKDRSILRSKVGVNYDIKGYPIDLFASVDFGCGLNYSATKWKFTGGYDYNIDKKNTLTLYYRYSTENDDDEGNGHLVGLGYKFNF